MNEWQIFLNGGIGVSSLVVVWLVIQHNAKMAARQQDVYTKLLTDFMKSVIDEMKETTNAVKELTQDIRREK